MKPVVDIGGVGSHLDLGRRRSNLQSYGERIGRNSARAVQ